MNHDIFNILAEQHFRFLLGIQFLTFVNFALLSITASTQIERFISPYVTIPTTVLIVVMLAGAFIGTWAFGTVMDVYIKYPQRQSVIGNERNVMLREIHAMLKKMEADV